ncbi:hypothetical protein PHMEG_00011811 [Phytophthora megakarya]|uniref:BED-type domain-containing protein n=1 Tax=Phytophthora megakarya TaxID=4795 RepID=A0A225WBS1_9STRA|nr:hypothetical protein PHMEG_00011811 [Phytophthora megakarya]
MTSHAGVDYINKSLANNDPTDSSLSFPHIATSVSYLKFHSTAMISNKQHVSFFHVCVRQDLNRCGICDSQRKQAFATGYSNLMAHLSGKHTGYKESFDGQHCVSLQALGLFWRKQKTCSNGFNEFSCAICLYTRWKTL